MSASDEEITVEALSSHIKFENRQQLEAFVAEAERRNAFGPLEWAARTTLGRMNGSQTPPPPPPPPPARVPETDEERDLMQKLAEREAALPETEAEYVEIQARMFRERDEARARIERVRSEAPGELAGAVVAECRAKVGAAEREESMARGRVRRARAARNAVAAALEDLRVRREARYHNARDPDRPLTHDEMLERLDYEGRENIWRPDR